MQNHRSSIKLEGGRGRKILLELGPHHPAYSRYRTASKLFEGLSVGQNQDLRAEPNSISTSHSRNIQYSGHIKTGLSMGSSCVLELISVNADPESP